MLKALVIKELRESAGIVAVAVLAALYVLAIGDRMRFLPYMLACERSGRLSVRQR